MANTYNDWISTYNDASGGATYNAAGSTAPSFAHLAEMEERTGLRVPPPPLLPPLQLIVEGRLKSRRVLNPPNQSDGPGSAAVADTIRFATIMPGGFAAFSCTIPDDERLAHPNAYVAKAIVTLKIADGSYRGRIVWQGELTGAPQPNADGSCTLEGFGWMGLLSERTTAMLWQIRANSDDFATADDTPFDQFFNNSGDLNADVKGAAITFGVPKGSVLKGGALDDVKTDKARVGAWSISHVLRRVAGTIRKTRAIPGGSGTPEYGLQLERYEDPTQGRSGAKVVQNMTTSLTAAADTDFDHVLGTPSAAIMFAFWRRTNTDSKGTKHGYRVSVLRARVSGDAYRTAPADWDVYSGTEMVRDMAARGGLNAGSRIGSTLANGGGVFNMLPFMWESASWVDLFDHLADHYAFKWALWELVNGRPDVEFGHWGTSWTKTWKVRAYGAQAFCDAELAPGKDELFSHVMVTFRIAGKKRWHTVTAGVNPNPLAGLPGPEREKTYHVRLPNPQPNDTMAKNMARTLADDFASVRLAGRIGPLTYVLDANDRPVSALLVAAGDLVIVSDHPDGARTLRIGETEYDEEQGMTLTAGPRPWSPHMQQWWYRRKRKRHRGHR